MAKLSKKFLTIRFCMVEKGMTQKDVARIIGTQIPSVSNRLNGKTPWTLPELLRLSKEFGKTLDELAI